MPKQLIDYSKTTIYRIICKNPEIKDCYVGSTTDFKSRKRRHKYDCNYETCKCYNLNIYVFIRNNGNWDNWDMLEIEKYKATDKADKLKRERYWLEFYNATLNSNIPSRDHKEYKKEWYNNNKERIITKVQDNYNQNKEQILEYHKKYYEENIEEIKLKNKEQITCKCGSIFRKSNKSSHEKTNKHIKYIEQNK